MEVECSWEEEAVSVSPELTYSGVTIRTWRRPLEAVARGAVAGKAVIGGATAGMAGMAAAGGAAAGGATAGGATAGGAEAGRTVVGAAGRTAVGRAAVKAAALAAVALAAALDLEAFLATEAQVAAIVEVGLRCSRDECAKDMDVLNLWEGSECADVQMYAVALREIESTEESNACGRRRSI